MIPPHLLTVDFEPFASGGFADVYRGSFNGLPVCVKRLRVATPDDIAVSYYYNTATLHTHIHA